MADRVGRRTAEAGVVLPATAGRVVVTACGPLLRFSARGDAVAATAIGRGYGVALPARPLTSSSNGDRHALWLGPDEWLLIAPVGEGAAVSKALAGAPGSIVDVSHRNAALVVAGPDAADLLAAGCPLDLDLAAFPVGQCTRTIFAKAEIVLWRRATDEFHVEAGRSFLPYLAGHLAEAARGLR